MMANNIKLEQLFRRCDTKGTGYIGLGEFGELCSGFGISENDSNIIFADLDHDGDGKINFDDFSFGFRDFLTPGSRRGSVQLGLPPSLPLNLYSDNKQEEVLKQRDMEVKHEKAQKAWKNFTDNIGKDNVRKFLATSGDKMFAIYEELQGSDAPPHIIKGFEDCLSSLLKDVSVIEGENKRMEELFNKERETHSDHLATIEAELDQQVAKVEAAAREKARADFENEKKELQRKMETEMAEMQTHLRLFQKVDNWMNKETDNQDLEVKQKHNELNEENRQLKALLNQTETNIAVLRSEMSQVRGQYENKVSELNMERENMMEYVYQYDNMHGQLELLQEANRKLQDTNDAMRGVVDIQGMRSPRLSVRGDPREPYSNFKSRDGSPADGLGGEIHKLEIMLRKNRRNGKGSRSPSEFGGSLADSDSMRSRESDRPKLTDVKFGIKRLMDDLDSGCHSTIPGDDDCEDISRNLFFNPSPSNLEEELETAEVLDSFDGEAGLESLEQQDRELEVSQVYDGGGEEEEEKGEGEKKEGEKENNGGGESAGVKEEKKRSRVVDNRFGSLPVRQPNRSRNPQRPLRKSFIDVRSLEIDGYRKLSRDRKSNSLTLVIPERAPTRRGMYNMEQQVRNHEPSSGMLRQLEPTGPPDRTYKVVFAGDAAVGKTSFINRITKGVFLSNLSSTLGVDFQVKTIRVDDRNIAIQLWDTAGQERFRSVTKTYFRRADGVMLLYDVTSERSFSSVRSWVENIDEVSEKRIPMVLCANKVDQRAAAVAEGRRCVSAEDGEKMARNHSAIFLETSSMDGKNIMESLVQLARDMCSTEDVEVQTSALKLRDEKQQKSNCCAGRRSSLTHRTPRN